MCHRPPACQRVARDHLGGAELNEQGRSPVYLVHFTQNACADTARDLLSTNFCTKEEKHAIAREVDSEEKSTSSLLLVC